METGEAVTGVVAAVAVVIGMEMLAMIDVGVVEIVVEAVDIGDTEAEETDIVVAEIDLVVVVTDMAVVVTDMAVIVTDRLDQEDQDLPVNVLLIKTKAQRQKDSLPEVMRRVHLQLVLVELEALEKKEIQMLRKNHELIVTILFVRYRKASRVKRVPAVNMYD